MDQTKSKPISLASVLAAADERLRRASALPPRLVRRDQAASYVTAPRLFELMEEAGWIVPTVEKNKMTLFDLNDLDACIERLKTGEYPGESNDDGPHEAHPNRTLGNIESRAVRQKITNDQALTLAELAVGFYLPYSTVKALAKDKTFPKVGAHVFPSDFKIWRRQTRGLQSSPGTPGRPKCLAANR